MIFFGRWERVLNKKGRVVIPKRFVKEMGKEILFIESENYLLVYPRVKIEELPPERMKSLWLAEFDKSGRIVIPEKIRKSLFRDCQKVIWEGWKDHFRIIPCNST